MITENREDVHDKKLLLYLKDTKVVSEHGTIRTMWQVLRIMDEDMLDPTFVDVLTGIENNDLLKYLEDKLKKEEN